MAKFSALHQISKANGNKIDLGMKSYRILNSI